MTFCPPDLSREPDLADVCVLLLQAERLAARCTAKQARLAGSPPLAKLLAAQQRHELAHAALFQAILQWAPRRPLGGPQRALAALQSYERHLDAALERGDLAGSLIGLQGVLEGIGTGLLQCFDASPAKEPLRRALLAQESAHHGAGMRWLARLAGPDAGALAAPARRFVDAGRSVLDASRSILRRHVHDLEHIDPAVMLPDWLRLR